MYKLVRNPPHPRNGEMAKIQHGENRKILSCLWLSWFVWPRVSFLGHEWRYLDWFKMNLYSVEEAGYVIRHKHVSV